MEEKRKAPQDLFALAVYLKMKREGMEYTISEPIKEDDTKPA